MMLSTRALLFWIFVACLLFVVFTLVMFLTVDNNAVKWGVWGGVTGFLMIIFLIAVFVYMRREQSKVEEEWSEQQSMMNEEEQRLRQLDEQNRLAALQQAEKANLDARKRQVTLDLLAERKKEAMLEKQLDELNQRSAQFVR
jgi:uncharacterized membrane protein YhiD involved in acid resistance